jgi:fumarate hydratase class I
MPEFIYEAPFQLSSDPTKYRLLKSDYVKSIVVDGRKILKVDPLALELLAKEAVSDISFYLRTAHLEKLAAILKDPEAMTGLWHI